MSINDTNLSLKMLEDSVDRLPPRQVQIPGPSAYEAALAEGFHGSRKDWLKSLRGAEGKSAYEVAVDNGFDGTEEEWVDFVSHVESEAQRQANETQRVEAEAKREALFEEWKAVIDHDQIKANQENISRNDKRITNLERGLPDDNFMVDETVAYTKDVPANALPYAEIAKIGGMTRKCTNLINFRDWTEEGTLNSDGSLTITTINSAFNILRTLTGLLPSGTYTLTNLSGTMVYVQASSSDYSRAVGVGTTRTFTYDGTSYLRIVYANQAENTTVTYRLMLNSGDTALPYEPYFEGLRSASATAVESVGANLTTAKAVYSGADQYAEMVVDGRNCIRFTSGLIIQNTPIQFEPNTQYTVSFYAKGENFNGATTQNIGFTFFYEDGTCTEILVGANDPWALFTLTSTIGKTIKSIGLASREYRAYVYLDTDTFMLNKGSTALPYTPYVEHSLPIPEAVQALDGYGDGVNYTVYNYIDWEKKQFVKRVGKVDMGTLEWVEHDNVFYCWLKKKEGISNLLCAIYPNADTGFSAMTEKTITGSVEYKFVYVKDSAYTDAASFKAAMSGVMLVYELSTPIVTDISDLITADNLIGVEGGGTLTFENEYGYAVPSEVVYQLKGATA